MTLQGFQRYLPDNCACRSLACRMIPRLAPFRLPGSTPGLQTCGRRPGHPGAVLEFLQHQCVLSGVPRSLLRRDPRPALP